MNSPDDFRNHVQDPEEPGEELTTEKPKTEKPRTERPRTEKPRTEKPRTEKPKMKKSQEEIFTGQTGSAKDLIITACILCILLCIATCVCVIAFASRKSAVPPVFPSPSSTLPRGAGFQDEAGIEAFANTGEMGAKASATLLQDIVAMEDEKARKKEKGKAGKLKKDKGKDAPPKDVKPEPRGESVSPAVPAAPPTPRISSPPSSPSPRDEGLGSAHFKTTLQKKAAEREARLEGETKGAETTERRRKPPRSMANRQSTEEARQEDGLAREALERAEKFREEAAREYVQAKKAALRKNPAKDSENASELGAASLAAQRTGALPR